MQIVKSQLWIPLYNFLGTLVLNYGYLCHAFGQRESAKSVSVVGTVGDDFPTSRRQLRIFFGFVASCQVCVMTYDRLRR